ncbi:MAG TPA: hypothetical protein VLI94_05335 [Solirubrobacterales bacterium]|nr:hypothetical protein [Solirubrobacterales bacterium]
MPEIVDRLILDPPEFALGRTPLDLTGAGLSVVEAEFGEETIETALIRQQLGEAVTDRHEPNKEIGFKLQVRAEGEVSLPGVATALQQKVGVLAREGGWLQRDFKVGGEFGSLACEVKRATLANFAGWQRGESPDVTLALLCGPLWYATDEIASSVFKLEDGRALEFTLPEVKGTGPGLIRCRVKNTGTVGLRGMILALESRDHPQDATAGTSARLVYQGSSLTPKGGSVVSGTSIFNNKSGPGRVILNSLVSGVGQMTHVGPRRIMVAATQEFGTGPVSLRLRWRMQGDAYWSEEAPVELPLDDAGHLLDLGEARPEPAVLGNRGWEWEIALEGSNQEVSDPTKAPSWGVRINHAFVLPAEQFASARVPQVLHDPTTFSAYDSFDQAAGELNGKALPSGGNWDSSKTEGTAPPDYKTTGTGKLIKDHSFVNGSRFAVPPGGPYNTVAASVVLRWSSLPQEKDIGSLGGQLFSGLRFGASGSWIAFQHDGQGSGSAGKASWEWTRLFIGSRGIRYTVKPGVDYQLTILVIQGYAILGWVSDPASESLGAPTLVSPVAPPTGQHIEIGDAYVGYSTAITRTFDDFRVWTPDLDVLCHANRSLELRSDGIYRQHLMSEVWGEIVNEGLSPYAPPSYLEDRSMRGVVIPSVGDLGEMPDSTGVYDLEAQVFYRPAFHFSREASES